MKRGTARAKSKGGSCERAIREYFGGILSGEIVACEKMKQVAAHVLRDMDNTDPLYPYHYREEFAQKHVRFIESFCRLPSGRLGHDFKLELFQRAILSVVFGFVDAEGVRQYREVLWIMGRKNGKTALASAIELDLLVNDDEGAPEVYNVATAHDQAAKGFNNAWRMVLTSPALAKHIRKRVSDLYCDLNMGTIKALSANTNHLDGLDISGAIVDELAAMKNRDLYDLTMQGTSARRQPLVLEITTNGFVRNGIFDAQYEYATKWLDGKATGEKAERFIAFIFELDERGEWQDEGAWVKANPGLGTIKSLSALRQNVSKAKDDATYLPTLLVKDFNLVENQSQAWLTWSEIHNEATFNPGDGTFTYAVLGVDAADTTDLTAACLLMQRPNDPNFYALHMAWIPIRALEQAEKEGRRGGRDGVPYDAWIARGLMRTCETPIMDKRDVLDWVAEVQDKYGIYAVSCGYDPWHMRDVPTVEAYEDYFGADNLQKVIQGAQTLSMPMKELRALYKEGRIVDNANPIAEWCRSNVAIRTDVNGNIQPDKKNQDPRNRIDAWAAECDAFIAMKNIADDYRAMIGG